MKYIKETLETPVDGKYDVLVAGGGVAGIAAALAAARNGSKVCLLEKQFMLGGLATAGLVTIYLPICDGKGTQVSFGIAEELLRLSIKYGYEKEYPSEWLAGGSMEERVKHRYRVQFNAQLFAIAAEELLLESGVKILYGTAACSIVKENNKISYVVVENKSGRSALMVKSVVDATGDADICALAMEDTVLHMTGNSLASWYYYCGKDGYHLNMLGFIELPDELKSDNQRETEGTVVKFQGIDGDEISDFMCLSHKALINDILARREKDGTILPVTIASIPQLRMTRRIAGDYTMQLTDDKAEFTDSVGMASNWRTRGPVYEIPFRCLHGNKVKNLITAGRCISAEDSMWDITRVIPVCAVTGEAAGTAAAMTDDFTACNVSAIQEQLKKQGVKLFYDEL